MSATNQLSTQIGGAAVEEIDANDRMIASIQSKRESFIAQLTPEGKLPSSAEDRAILMGLLNGAASTAIACKKIKAEEKTSVSQQQMAQAMADAVRVMQATQSANHRNRLAPPLRDVPLVEVELVEGNTDIGTRPVSTSAVALGSSEIFTDQ